MSWLTVFPGLFVLLAVLSVNFMGDGLRDALDPKMVFQTTTGAAEPVDDSADAELGGEEEPESVE